MNRVDRIEADLNLGKTWVSEIFADAIKGRETTVIGQKTKNKEETFHLAHAHTLKGTTAKEAASFHYHVNDFSDLHFLLPIHWKTM